MRRKFGDRRNRPRYDIVGDLWGTLETTLGLSLKNVSPGGALVESPVSLAPGAVHRLTFDCEGRDTAMHVRVRHVSSVVGPDGTPSFLIGVEFMSVHPALAEQVRRWTRADTGAEPAEA